MPVAARLTTRRSLMPDLPGLGRSVAAGPFSVARAARAVAELIRERVPDGRVYVVGHSLGGAVAAQLMADAPELVERAVLIGVTAVPAPGLAATIALMTMLGPLMRTELMIGIAARAMRVPADHLTDFRADQLGLKSDALRAVLREGAEFRVPAALAAFDRPALVLVGARELRVNLESAVALATVLPRGEARLAPGGHAWFGEHPELLVAVLSAWFNGETLPEALGSLPVRGGARPVSA